MIKAANLAAAATLGLVATLSPTAQAQEITLRVADSFPTTHPLSQNTRNWIERVEELTDGRVALEYYPAEQLSKAADMLDAAQNGIADIVYAAPLYLSDRLPLSTVTALPGVGDVSSEAGVNEAFHTLVMEELNEAEFLPQGLRAIRAQTSPPYQLMMREEKVTSVAQLEGKKIRSSGGVQERSVKRLGAIPTAIPAPDLYPAIQRGTVDGAFFNLPTAKGYSLEEQLKWSTDNLNLGLFPTLYVINTDVWEDLPEDIQEALVQAGLDILPAYYENSKAHVQDFGAALETRGGGLYQVPEDAKAELDEALAPVQEAWVEDMESRDLPGRRIFDRWQALLTR